MSAGQLRLSAGLIPAELIAEAVATLQEMAEALGAPASGDLDDRISYLAAGDRAALSTIYDAFRESLVFQRIITAAPLVEAARAMAGAKRVHAPFQHAVFRMDLAGEAWRGFGWHQDYPYNMLSERYVTAWLPLTDSGPHNGSIQAAPNLSDRVHPVEIRFKRNGAGERLATRDAFIAERLQSVFDSDARTLELEAGDVAMFDNRLVHRSGFNPGPRHRYSIQVRFGALMAPEVVARRWANRRQDGFETFKALHPELVEFEET